MANWWSLFREIRGRSEKGQVCDRTVEETWCFWKISFAELECHERQSGSLVGLQDRPRLAILPFVFSLQIAPTQVCWAFYVRWQRVERGTTRIRAAVRRAAVDRYILPTGPTATNLLQRVCCCGPIPVETDGRRLPDICIDDPALHSMRAVTIIRLGLCDCWHI